MSILRSFTIGVGGLQAIGGGMSVTGDNIANSQTNGFKASRPEFQDVLATSLKGIDGGDQIGSGVRLAHITPNFTQGNVSRTENITDLAINGNGFFQVESPFGHGYTRDGQFHFDKEGYLINGDGYKARGFRADADGNIINKPSTIKLGNTTIPAKATSKVEVMMNLDSRDDIQEFNIEDPEKTSSFNNSVSVFDNVGTQRLVTVYFNKTDNNQWEYHAVVDAEDAAGGGDEGTVVEMASGKVIFNDKGELLQEEVGSNAFNFNKGAAPEQKIELSFGKSITEGGTGLQGATQYGSKSAVSRHTQNGASAATITSMSFNDEGLLSAFYSNGETRNIGLMGVAKFENNEGLFKMGKNLFKASLKSGQGALGKPGQTGRGQILSKSVELSNVDIANEFVNLMTAQRNFQANTRTITTADQMLQEVLNIKR
ncbi:MAG: flagellar hook protein FlgE [Bacteriovoracaceae bacterium]|jgi:flagellar hook protein FlgE|nr:flagellar hook protein FlgE [Bacteriovoracaceae bacterium]